MKVLKLSVFALVIGFFVASCGNPTSDEPIDETEIMEDPLVEPEMETVNPVDTELIDSTTIITE